MVCVKPGAFRVVILAPTANGSSILAVAMTPPGQAAGFVHTAHTASAFAEQCDDPPNGPFDLPMAVILLVAVETAG
jgi:hypothetical protein